ncbi:hypothetical protein MNV_700045 [Candidatus Methanoperedens nitroreducens]|uniref:Uncharacterized protein n=1 Tax=Candidatus Methanoperedens nitratireducens TaxID=1392998 RepID=A0A284VSX8_9EURY|nr:hypothetical protein MNV_700045 [Candidatus Methanoperedens nitroreducens]
MPLGSSSLPLGATVFDSDSVKNIPKVALSGIRTWYEKIVQLQR